METFATAGLQPDLTLWLDVPLQEALLRREHRGNDRIEAEGEAFLQRVQEGFALLAQRPGWCRVVHSERGNWQDRRAGPEGAGDPRRGVSRDAAADPCIVPRGGGDGT
ncbi:MAG: dTMP kinase, partial [bacterium]